MADLVKASDLETWYTRINGIRDKENIKLGDISIPSVQYSSAKASHVNDAIAQITGLYVNTYFSYADQSTPLESVSVGELIKKITSDNIDDRLTALEAICANYVVETTESGVLSFGTTSFEVDALQFSTSSQSTNSTNSTCSTFSTTSNFTNVQSFSTFGTTFFNRTTNTTFFDTFGTEADGVNFNVTETTCSTYTTTSGYTTNTTASFSTNTYSTNSTQSCSTTSYSTNSTCATNSTNATSSFFTWGFFTSSGSGFSTWGFTTFTNSTCSTNSTFSYSTVGNSTNSTFSYSTYTFTDATAVYTTASYTTNITTNCATWTIPDQTISGGGCMVYSTNMTFEEVTRVNTGGTTSFSTFSFTTYSNTTNTTTQPIDFYTKAISYAVREQE